MRSFDFENEDTPVVDVAAIDDQPKTTSGRRSRLTLTEWIASVNNGIRDALRRTATAENGQSALAERAQIADERRHDLEVDLAALRVLLVGEQGNNGKIGALRLEMERTKDEATKSARFIRRAAISGLIVLAGSVGSGWVAMRDTIAGGAVRTNEILHLREEMRELRNAVQDITRALMQRKE